MIERLKTIALVLLVGSSLLQSYLLVYSKPDFDPATQNEYVETELIGTSLKIEQLIYPQDMVIHFGNDEHSVVYPHFYFYDRIMDEIQRHVFDGLKQLPPSQLPNTEWYRTQPGIELRFSDNLPLSLLDDVLQLQLGSTDPSLRIERIWITLTEQTDDVRIYFYTNQTSQVYEVIRSDLKVDDIEQLTVAQTGWLTPYERWFGQLYLPVRSLTFAQLFVPTFSFTPEQMQKSIFVDPGMSHNLLERDGTEIFTDGKKGLQINHRHRWLSYSDPGGPARRETGLKEDLLTAVQFVNQQGGWNGQYLLTEIPREKQPSFIFRAYVPAARHYVALPIISNVVRPFGYIQLQLQNGQVTNYERSLVNLNGDEIETGRLQQLEGGEDLKKVLSERHGRYSIASVFPAYFPQFTEDGMELRPVWAVELNDGTIELLP